MQGLQIPVGVSRGPLDVSELQIVISILFSSSSIRTVEMSPTSSIMKCNTLAWETAAHGGAEHVQRVPSSVGGGARSPGRPEKSRALRAGYCPGTGPCPGDALAGTQAQRPAHPHRLLPAPQGPGPSGGALAGSGPSAPPARSLGPPLCEAATAPGLVAGTDCRAASPAAASPGRQPRGHLSMGVCRGPRLDSLSGAPPPAAEASRLLPPAHEGPYPGAGGHYRAPGRGQYATAARALGGGPDDEAAGAGGPPTCYACFSGLRL